jgi:hypothetical protein
LNPGRRGGKPATNRLSYGAAIDYALAQLNIASYATSPNDNRFMTWKLEPSVCRPYGILTLLPTIQILDGRKAKKGEKEEEEK